MIRRAIEHAAIPRTFDVVLSSDPISCAVDGPVLEYVVRRLLRHVVASHHARAGSITIGVAVCGDHLRISVSDDGTPWPHGDEIARLGSIVELHGGMLALASAPPRGNTIAFTWPTPRRP